ncbi:MAG TPA: transglutaminase domain-containing protein [Dehalococcoidia bacterium]|nr:transglutaminase domain-containing protein [Dehalococcoidia bacterium]
MSAGKNITSSSTEATAMPDGLESSENVFRRVFRRYFPLMFILWIIFVLYPNPLNFIISVQRLFNFDVDPGAVGFMLNDFPSDPVDIEKAVLARISYRHDWELYSMPWYFPTIEQVLERGEGDCKARALVLASVLEAKNIPYQVNSSPIHVWVDYEGKQETSIENDQVKYYQRDPETGERRFQIPDIGLSEVMDSFWRAFWGPMPDGRKALLISGLFALVAARVILRKKRTAQ